MMVRKLKKMIDLELKAPPYSKLIIYASKTHPKQPFFVSVSIKGSMNSIFWNY